ncbi:MAG TPA: hypothetical protein VFU69_02870, partial [Ktedonobacterales bacterium]|nr:hypothetical protein [Ktedonobacterales bacterium]
KDPFTRQFTTDRVINEGLNYQETKLAVDEALGLLEETTRFADTDALDGDAEEEVFETNDSLLRQQREPLRGLDRLRQQSERLIHTIEQLVSDTRIDRQELREALEQVHTIIFQHASDLS